MHVTTAIAAAVAVLGLLWATTADAQGLPQPTCAAVPTVPILDQSASSRSDYGRCTDATDPHVRPHSNWCQYGKLGYWPAGPSKLARSCMKFGRMTVYRGPIYGSEPKQKGACNAPLVGSNETAMVAVSTKYLKTAQGGWVADKGACGQCMCIHMRGVDDKYNVGVKYYHAKQYFGLTFLAKVGDRCGECEDDHIDVLLDAPVSYAPFDPTNPKENTHAQYVNSFPALRGFGNPWLMRGGKAAPESVGTWVADWQWVPCATSSHDTCATLMRAMGYKQVWVPQPTVGVHSANMTKADTPLSPAPWSRPSSSRKVPFVKPAVGPTAQCGGAGQGCKGVVPEEQCLDQQWATCPKQFACKRQNEWYWGCEPAAA